MVCVQKSEHVPLHTLRLDLIQKRAEKTEPFNALQYALRESDTNNGLVLRRLSTRHSPQWNKFFTKRSASLAFWMQPAPSNLLNFHRWKGANLWSRERNFQFSRNHIKSPPLSHQTRPSEVTEHDRDPTEACGTDHGSTVGIKDHPIHLLQSGVWWYSDAFVTRQKWLITHYFIWIGQLTFL